MFLCLYHLFCLYVYIDIDIFVHKVMPPKQTLFVMQRVYAFLENLLTSAVLLEISIFRAAPLGTAAKIGFPQSDFLNNCNFLRQHQHKSHQKYRPYPKPTQQKQIAEIKYVWQKGNCRVLRWIRSPEALYKIWCSLN